MEKMNIDGFTKWLAVGIILLFVGTCIIPAIAQDTEKILSASRGNWLYVGGSGPGNFTRIQDAIDNASDGDTVYVYQGIYPDYTVIEEKNLTLIGEDKYTTILTNYEHFTGPILIIRHTFRVNISGFTIQPSYICTSGIQISTSRNMTIHDIIIQNISSGISMTYVDNCSFYNNTITMSYTVGLYVGSGTGNCLFYNNILSNNTHGIELGASGDCLFSNNTVFKNSIGLYIYPSSGEQIIEYNDIRENGQGIKINYQTGFKTIIRCNNIVNNTDSLRSAVSRHLPTVIRSLFSNLAPNAEWDKNYWSDWKTLSPRPIISWAHIWVHSLVGGGITIAILPTIKLDWHPAQEPYDIPGMR